MTAPRIHHYRFVHRELAGAVLRFGLPLEAATALPRITELWTRLGTTLRPDARLPDTGLSAHDLPTGLLVTLPAPVSATEAYFAAAVRPEGSEAARYLTLERSHDPFDSTPTTTIREWSRRGHRVLGPGSSPVPELFAAAVEHLLGPGRRRR